MELAWMKSTRDTPVIVARAGGMGSGTGLTTGLTPAELQYKEASLHGSFASRNGSVYGVDGLNVVIPSDINDSGHYYCLLCFQPLTVSGVTSVEVTVRTNSRGGQQAPGPQPLSPDLHSGDSIEWCGETLIELRKYVPSVQGYETHPRVNIPVTVPRTTTTKREPTADAPVTGPRTKATERALSVSVKERVPERYIVSLQPTDDYVYTEQRYHVGTYVSLSLFLCCVLVCAVRITKRKNIPYTLFFA